MKNYCTILLEKCQNGLDFSVTVLDNRQIGPLYNKPRALQSSGYNVVKLLAIRYS